MTNFEPRESKRAATAAALADLAEPLAAALTAESGDEWAATVAYWPEGDGPGAGATESRRVRSVTWTRQRDGFAVYALPPSRGRVEMRILWPENPAQARTACPRYHYRNAPGVAYDAPEPGIGFALEKARPATVARRVLRELVRPEYEAARAALIQTAADYCADRDRAAEWRRLVSAAAGIPCTESHYERGGYRWGTGADDWARIETPCHDLPRGSLTIDLPTDPADAARVVAAIRAVVTGESGQ